MTDTSTLRQRHKKTNERDEDDGMDEVQNSSEDKKPHEAEMRRNLKLEKHSYWLTRIVIIRYLGFIYFVAFLVALHQNKQLCGHNGLIPAQKFLKNIERRTGGINLNTFTQIPSLVWFIDYEKNLDLLLDITAYAGLVLSSFLIIVGGANWIIMLALWILYHSIVNIGSTWLGVTITGDRFLGNLPNTHAVGLTSAQKDTYIPYCVARIQMADLQDNAGSSAFGLIKIRGDQCWRDLTCMNYHYETQPVPNPISYYMHQEPEFFHKFETLTNHFVELIAPAFLFLPRPFRMIGGFIQIMFQVVLIISGNLSFLNWLTILPSLACFDDASLSWMFSKRRNSVPWRVREIQQQEKAGQIKLGVDNYIRRVFNLSVGLLIAYLSIPVVQNLMSSRQYMNTSFDPLRIVNTYGAFGSITKDRTEVIFEGTYDNPSDSNAKWLEYEFKCKPGNTTRRPCLISPYHYRLDWLMWFAAFQNYQHNPWLVHLGVKLLANDEGTESLIAHNPFHGKNPPRFIRAEHYRYRYTKLGSREAAKGQWWKRKRIGSYLPPISLDSIKEYMKHMDYEMPRPKKRRRP